VSAWSAISLLVYLKMPETNGRSARLKLQETIE